MKYHILICCVFVSFALKCQTESKRILGSFNYKNSAYNYEFTSEDNTNFQFIISAIQHVEAQRDSLLSSGATVKDDNYLFSEFTKEIFESVFLQQMKRKYGLQSSDTLKNKSSEIFYTLIAKLDFLDDEPVTAYLILKYDNIYSYLKSNSSRLYNGSLSKLNALHKVERVDVETEDGAIKNIKVRVIAPETPLSNSSPRKYLDFKNGYPISISGKYDADKFANIRLYCFNCTGVKGLVRFIKFSDLLALDIVLQNDKEDYSPSNITVSMNPSKPIVELKKEKRSRILEVAAFTDFVGLDQEQPNGLIQFEAKRKINIITQSQQIRRFDKYDEFISLPGFEEISRKADEKGTTYVLIRKPKEDEKVLQVNGNKNIETRKYTGEVNGKKLNGDSVTQYTFYLKNKNFHPAYWTFFNSIEPRLLFSKLEQNNRFMDSLKIVDHKIDATELIRYQAASFGANLNFLKVHFPQEKFSWNVLSVGVYWSRTRIGNGSDSTKVASIPLNSSHFVLSGEFVFKPDSRWGATFGMNVIRPMVWDKIYETTNSRPVVQYYFEGHLKTSDANKLFFRFRWTYEYKNYDNNFTQVQLGYSANLFSVNPKVGPK